jgi:hypothetical protein
MRPLHVATALDTDAATRPDFARGYHVQTVIEAIYRSSAGAGWVSCDLSTQQVRAAGAAQGLLVAPGDRTARVNGCWDSSADLTSRSG